jgi:hypothetical protein
MSRDTLNIQIQEAKRKIKQAKEQLALAEKTVEDMEKKNSMASGEPLRPAPRQR